MKFPNIGTGVYIPKICAILAFILPQNAVFFMAGKPEAPSPTPLPDFTLGPLNDRSIPITREWLREYSQLREKPGFPDGVTAKTILANTYNIKELSRAEIFGLVNGYTSGEIPDYQMSTWLGFVAMREKFGFRLTDDETIDLTLAMAASGQMLDLKDMGTTVDKHSS